MTSPAKENGPLRSQAGGGKRVVASEMCWHPLIAKRDAKQERLVFWGVRTGKKTAFLEKLRGPR